MTRKCISCNITTELKGIVMPDCDCGKCDGWHKTSICKTHYFDQCSCEEDGHDVLDCLQDKTCNNHEKTLGLYRNWNDYDYHFKLKSTITHSKPLDRKN